MDFMYDTIDVTHQKTDKENLVMKWEFECNGEMIDLTDDMESFRDLHELDRPFHFVVCHECHNVPVLHLLEERGDIDV